VVTETLGTSALPRRRRRRIVAVTSSATIDKM
jgi:hypothetical protein